MAVYQLSYKRYQLSFRHPVRTAHGPWSVRDGVWLRLENDSGQMAYGEAAPIPWFGTENVEEIISALQRLGETPSAEDLASIPARLGCLKFGLAQALGCLETDAPKRPYLPVAALLPAGRESLTNVRDRLELGFRTFKWKVGVMEAADERAILDDLLSHLPSGARLRLDANGAWERREAERWLEFCADRPIEFIEQPVSAAERKCEDWLRGLAQDFPTPLALDESLTQVDDVDRWLGLGWPGVWVLKLPLLADPLAALDKLRSARAPVVFSSALESPIAAKAALSLALSWPVEPKALGYGVWPLFAESRFDAGYNQPMIRSEDVNNINPEVIWNAKI